MIFVKKYLGLTCIFLSLLLGSGCQPTAPKTPPTVTLTQTARPTLTDLPSVRVTVPPPTSTSEPTAATTPTAPLSLEAPWLAYPAGKGIAIVNQDGSGRTQFDEPGRSDNFPAFLICQSGPVVLDESPFNRMVNIDGGIHVVRHPNWMSVYRPFQRRGCDDIDLALQKDGTYLLASIPTPKKTAEAELTVYELPSGKVRDRLPLVKCAAQAPKECAEYPYNWQVEWSPNNRYLAFPRVFDSTSTDLYIYDSKDGNTRRLTSGPENVDHFWWSPDGAWIIMSEGWGLLSAADYKPALWAVSLETGEIRFLYTLTTPYLSIPYWINNESFLSVDGYIYIADETANNLRLVSISGTTKLLFSNTPFYSLDLDGKREHAILWSFEDGMYLISFANPTPILIGGGFLYPDWNDDLGLFVGEDNDFGLCPNQPDKLPAFDLHGKIQCIEKPIPTPEPTEENVVDTNISPNQRWRVLLTTGAGVSVENVNDKSLLAVTKDPGTQVVWCPDSTCFFLVSKKMLYHVTFPGLVMQVVDAGLGKDTIDAVWMEKP